MFLPYRLFLWHSRNLLFPRPSIRAAGLDKTGTLTKGEFAVLHVEEFKTSIAQAGATCMNIHVQIMAQLEFFHRFSPQFIDPYHILPKSGDPYGFFLVIYMVI